MIKYYIIMIFISFSCYTYSQKSHVSTLKQSYSVQDTIQLKIFISRPGVYLMGIGLEYKHTNKWFELEPTVNQIGKTEVFSKNTGSVNKIMNVILPGYIEKFPEEDFPINIRFRLVEGVKIGKWIRHLALPFLLQGD